MKHLILLTCLVTSGCLLSLNDGREGNTLMTQDDASADMPTPDASRDMPADTTNPVDMSLDADTSPPVDMPTDAPVDMPEDMPVDIEPDLPVDPCAGFCLAPLGCQLDGQGMPECIPAPKTCEEAKAAGTLAAGGLGPDDFATLYVGNDPAKEWSATCHKDGSDIYREFLQTRFAPGMGTSVINNTAVDYASGVQTVYDQYRIDPITLIVDGSNTDYATTTALDLATPVDPAHRGDEQFTFAAPAMVRGCGTGAMGPGQTNNVYYPAETQFDIEDTGLAIKSDFIEHGLCPGVQGDAVISFNGRKTAVTLNIAPNTAEPGCTGLAPRALANKFEVRCDQDIARASNRPMEADFQIQLEHIGLP